MRRARRDGTPNVLEVTGGGGTLSWVEMSWGFRKIRGKPYEQMDDLEGKNPYFRQTPSGWLEILCFYFTDFYGPRKGLQKQDCMFIFLSRILKFQGIPPTRRPRRGRPVTGAPNTSGRDVFIGGGHRGLKGLTFSNPRKVGAMMR